MTQNAVKNKFQDQQGQNVQEQLELAKLYHKAGNFSQAEDIYRNTLERDPSNTEAHHLLGLLALQAEKFSIAKKLLETAVQLEPEQAQYQANLGAAYYALSEKENAKKAYQKAVSLDEYYGEAFLNLGLIYKEDKYYDEAVKNLEESATKAPSAKAFAHLGNCLLKLGRTEEADEIVRAAANLDPEDESTMSLILDDLVDLQRPMDALKIGQKLVSHEPINSKYRIQLVNALTSAGYGERAEEEARLAVNLDPQNASTYGALHQAYMIQGKWEESLDVINQALSLMPGKESFIAQKAGALEKLQRYQEAYQLVKPLIQGRSTYNIRAINVFTSIAKKYEAQQEAAQFLDLLVSNPNLPLSAKMQFYFNLGELHDQLGEYDTAFENFYKANNLKPRKYFAQSEEEAFQDIVNTFTTSLFSKFTFENNYEDLDYRPIFIVGMPRSGTTLIEQMIASHPDAFGAGELKTIGDIAGDINSKVDANTKYPEVMNLVDEKVLSWARNKYNEHLKELINCDEVKAITDKMPQNFIYLGLITLMFPEAAIIHCRRDPIDTCLSCYFQNFTASGLSFSYSLEGLGHYYRLYEQLMEHWKEVLPLQILDVDYESLVQDTKNQVENILYFCSLSWNDKCLRYYQNKRTIKTASYDQAVKPVYTSSVSRWKRYKNHIKPLVRSLGKENMYEL